MFKENNSRPKSVLITGITGSGGSYLAEHINNVSPETSIHGISRWHSTTSHKNLDAISSSVAVHECDLTDLSSVIRTLNLVRPDAIFHLASHANVRASFDNPLSVISNNVSSTANLFEALRLLKDQQQLNTKVLMCSTSEVYGQVDPAYVPIKEDCPIQTSSPYAVSKVAQDLIASTYFKAFGIPAVITRMFAYINPRRDDLFATAFAMQVARIECGLQNELVHGNLDSIRTLVDVRDAMSAYWTCILNGRVGSIYNIGGDSSLSVGDFLDILVSKARVKIQTRMDPALLRPADVTLQVPDTAKFRTETGWNPVHSFDDSVEFLLEHCRRRVNNGLHA